MIFFKKKIQHKGTENIDGANKRKHDAFDWATLILLGLTFCTTAAYTTLTSFQLEVAKDTEQKQLRAYIGADIPEHTSANNMAPPNKPNFIINVRNSGLTPAFKAVQRQGAAIDLFPLPNNFTFPLVDPNGATTPATILPGQFMTGGGIDVDLTQSLTQQEFAAVQDPNHRLYIYGTIWYADVFGKPHWTNWCFAISRIQNHEKGTVIIEHSSCSKHNDTDEG